MTPKTILCVVGTRPEAIKMAPVILALKNEAWASVRVLATAQHREMLDQVLCLFDIEPDVDLDLMQHDQSLAQLTARLITTLDETLEREAPDVVLSQGDTTTVLMTALACFYRKIAFGHVEAGLRTWNMQFPYPEEMNRVLASQLTGFHFAPTQSARENLLRSHIPEKKIHVTGNTVIDALLQTAQKDIPIGVELDPQKRLILVTAHRRENFGEPFINVLRALRVIADQYDDVELLYPVHPNPNVHEPAHRELGDHPRIHLCEPLDYGPFISAMKGSFIILTDSGGVQEEAPALAKPVLVLRAETERPEAVDEKVVKLVGPDYDNILRETEILLNDPAAYKSMARGVSPYGDGHASERIVRILKQSLTE